MATRLVSILIAGVLVAAPCAAQQPVTRDSAGIRIVENRARASAPLFRLGSSPVLNVGGLESDPAVEFDHRDGYLRGVYLSSGGLAVIDVARVHYFDGRGARIRISGTKGQGPLELLGMTAVCVTRGDTVVVSDTRNNRVAILDERGKIVRTIPRGSNGTLGFNACLTDGTFLLDRTNRAAAAATGQPNVTTFERTRLDGTIVNTIGPITLAPRSSPSVRIMQAGGRDRIYFSSGAENQIRIFSPSGTVTGILRTADPLRRLTAEEFARRTDAAQATASGTGRPAAAVPTHWPPYSELHVGTDGWLWAQEYWASGSEAQTWIAFDANGVLVGKLVIPAKPGDNPEVIGFGRGTVLLRRWDADRATFLTAYPLERVSGG